MNAREKLRRFDLMGNVLFISGSTALVMALTWGGHPYSWSSAAVLVPLIVGLTLLASLFWVEQRAFEPAVPLTLLSNRTSAAGYASTCLHAITVLAIIYYWPIYFQVVKQTSAVRSGINLFPLSFTIAPFVREAVSHSFPQTNHQILGQSIIAGFIVAKTHRYKALNCLSASSHQIYYPDSETDRFIKWIMAALGFGLMYLIKPSSPTAMWAGM